MLPEILPGTSSRTSQNLGGAQATSRLKAGIERQGALALCRCLSSQGGPLPFSHLELESVRAQGGGRAEHIRRQRVHRALGAKRLHHKRGEMPAASLCSALLKEARPGCGTRCASKAFRSAGKRDGERGQASKGGRGGRLAPHPSIFLARSHSGFGQAWPNPVASQRGFTQGVATLRCHSRSYSENRLAS